MNTFANTLNNMSTMGYTENGAVKYTTTNSSVYDLFALGGAYRTRSDADIIKLFTNAFDENPKLAVKCLFYLRDVRGGQGERRFFRVAMTDLTNKAKSIESVRDLISLIPEYGRWDDVIYIYTNSKNYAVKSFIIELLMFQLEKDIIDDNPSLLAKWMPSESASNSANKRLAREFAHKFSLTSRSYRTLLSFLRKKINIVERKMSSNDWESIEFDKLPSKAGFKYRNCFSTRKETAKRYLEFISDVRNKVHSATLYPYEIVEKCWQARYGNMSDTEIMSLNKYWENLPNYFGTDSKSAICVVDTSGSMYGNPINVAISLGMYCAERLRGPFKDSFITFSAAPEVQKVQGKNIVEKVLNLSSAAWDTNTNLTKTFDLLYSIAVSKNTNPEDIPDSLIIISDMEIDSATHKGKPYLSTMENVRQKWEEAGLKMPHLVYWNVNARNDTILDRGDNVTCVSGLSPVIFESVLSGKTGIDVMLDKLNSKRYEKITI